MSFGEKIKAAFKKIKTKLIVFLILLLVIDVWALAPLTVSLADANAQRLPSGKLDWEILLTEMMKFLAAPWNAFKLCLTHEYIPGFITVQKTAFGFFGVFAVIGLIRAIPTHEYENIENGSSDWCEGGEQYKVLNRSKGIVLAEKNYLPVDKRGNVNVLVVGGSGAGKSASFVIPNALQLLGSYVFTDPKGELYDKTAGFFAKNGYKIKVLNLVHPVHSDGYNPLFHIKNEIDVDIIANTIVKGQGEGKSSDPFWDDMSEMLLKALIYYLKATRPMEEQSLASCSELVRTANSSGGDNLLTNLMNQLPFDHPARMYYKNIEMLPDKTFGSVLGSLQSKLGKFDSREIAEVTSTNTIQFSEIGQEKTAVYVISSDTHTAYDFLLTIFFSQMIQQLYDYADAKGGQLPIPTYFILDEFANIGQIPDFDKKISTSRSRKISFSVILQNLDQLEAVYKESYETIIGNCDTHLFLGSNSAKTVEYFSKALGEKTIFRNSISVNKDREDWKQGKSESDQNMARALMTPDELRRMDNDLCIIYEKGIKPIKANKYYYFKYKEGKLVERYKLDHNDVSVERGKWKKYNPYAADDDDETGGASESLETIDKLFADDEEESPLMVENKKAANNNNNNNAAAASSSNFSSGSTGASSSGNSGGTGPDLEDKRQEELFDIQKELEAKFDELFGSMDD